MPEPEIGTKPEQTAIAVFGTGCFWCSEAVFSELNGVLNVEPGYMGGDPVRATYKEVCTGNTGHAEVSRITFDPHVITFADLLKVFWRTHDPTSLNRQGGDVGPQYRSVIFHADGAQQEEAERQRDALDRAEAWPRPIVTQITPMEQFHPAEEYHKEYFANNPEQGYCQMVIRPKMEKFRRAFPEMLKHDTEHA